MPRRGHSHRTSRDWQVGGRKKAVCRLSLTHRHPLRSHAGASIAVVYSARLKSKSDEFSSSHRNGSGGGSARAVGAAHPGGYARTGARGRSGITSSARTRASVRRLESLCRHDSSLPAHSCPAATEYLEVGAHTRLLMGRLRHCPAVHRFPVLPWRWHTDRPFGGRGGDLARILVTAWVEAIPGNRSQISYARVMYWSAKRAQSRTSA